MPASIAVEPESWRRVYMATAAEQRSKLIALRDLHRYSKSWCDAVTHPKLAGAMANLIGPNVELHHTTLHTKPPETCHWLPTPSTGHILKKKTKGQSPLEPLLSLKGKSGSTASRSTSLDASASPRALDPNSRICKGLNSLVKRLAIAAIMASMSGPCGC